MKYDQTKHLSLVYSEEDLTGLLRISKEEAAQIAPEAIQKGGAGSGKKGHVTAASYVEKLKNSTHFEGFKTGSGKNITNHHHHGTAAGYTPQDHKDAAEFHFKQSKALNQKRTTMNHEEGKHYHEAAKIHAKHMKQHLSQAGRIEDRRKQTVLDQRAKKPS